MLAAVHTAAEKHQMVVKMNQLLSNRVFETGMDQAVLALAERVKLPGFMLVYRDAVESNALHYRVYRHGRLEYESGEQPHQPLEAAIRAHGQRLIQPQDDALRKVLGSQKAVEAILVTGASSGTPLGKILVWSQGEGFSAFTLDLIRVLAATLSQQSAATTRRVRRAASMTSGLG